MSMLGCFFLLLTAVYCQGITCRFEKEGKVTVVGIVPGTPVEIPSLPYVVSCMHLDTMILNAATPRPGHLTTLHTSHSVPYHLTFRHHNPLILKVSGSEIVVRPRLEAIREEKDRVADQSFIAKYWMYIVPFVLIMLLTSGGEEEPATSTTATIVAK